MVALEGPFGADALRRRHEAAQRRCVLRL